MDFNIEALKEAEKSQCKKRKVGAIIADEARNKIISRGHNRLFGNLYGATTECEDAYGNTKKDVVHAEIDAIANATESLEDYTIYVTHQPCNNCSKAIYKAGLKLKIVNDFMKFDKDKLQYGLIPPIALKGLAEVLTYGAKKYKPNNWQSVDDTSRYIDALYRHLEAWRAGEAIDSESGLSHLSHAMTNISFLLYFDNKDIK